MSLLTMRNGTFSFSLLDVLLMGRAPYTSFYGYPFPQPCLFFSLVFLCIFLTRMAAAFEAVTVTDSAGNVLTLTRPPGRIACLYAFCGHVVTMLDRGKDMVAIVNGLKKDLLLHQVVPEIKDMPVPAKGGIISIEADWTNAAGVINVSLGTSLHGKGDKSFADIEQILIWNPEVIIVNEDGVDEQILVDKKWSSIKAVKDSNVFSIPVGISRWGHPGGLETPLAILWTAKTVYPDLFQDIDLKKEVTLFYKNFFNMVADQVS